MTDTAIKCFLTVCKTLNFTRSGDLLYMSQQAVSKHINTLEQELGYQLFVRGRRNVELTEIGEIYYRIFSHWENELKEADAAAQLISNAAPNVIRIGYLPRVKFPLRADQAIHRYKIANPQSRIDYLQIAGSKVEDMLRQDLIDFGITHGFFLHDMPDFECVNIHQAKSLIAISEYHPLYSDPIDTSRFADMVYLYELMENNTEEEERSKLIRQFSAFPSCPRTMKQVKTHGELELAVQMGEGITCCSDITFLPSQDKIHVCDTGSSSMLSIAWRKSNRKPTVQALAEYFRKAAI